MNTLSVALQSGTILLREGLEAMLVIAALAAFLRRTGARAALRALYLGALLAVLASFVAAIVFEIYFNGAHDDRLEAVVMIVASALMLYMSGWLFLRQDPRVWQLQVQRSVERALSSGTAIWLALIAFLAVFREGGETVLFLHALAGTSGGWNASLVAGLIVAAVCLVALYAAMQWLALQLPLRPFFLVTSAFLFIMGLHFVGGAIQELQEQVLIPYDVALVPDWVISLGVNPTWEAIGAQLIIAIVAIVSTLVLHLRRPVPAARKSEAQ
jgi:high-affinity iron transporter